MKANKIFKKKILESGLPAASFYKYDEETDSFKSCSIRDIEVDDIFIRIDISDKNEFLWVAKSIPFENKDHIWTIQADTLNYEKEVNHG